MHRGIMKKQITADQHSIVRHNGSFMMAAIISFVRALPWSWALLV
jgi:hypothetical protein